MKHKICWIFSFGCLILLIMSCKSKPLLANVSDENICIQVMKLDQPDGIARFNVRIYPKKELLAADAGIAQKMMYGNDSCFYLLQHSRKVYPISTECIANGVANTFEYLVIFEGIQTRELFYQDKYINQKNYQFVLK